MRNAMRHEQGMSNHGINYNDNKEPAGATKIKYKEMEVVLPCTQDWSSQNTVVLITNIAITTPQLQIID